MAIVHGGESDVRDMGTAPTVVGSQGKQGVSREKLETRASRFGRYVVVDLLGAGGMGAVYSAYDPHLDRRVAIKIMKHDSADAAERERLMREAKAMARLTHPNVVAVYDAGNEDGEVYVAMEYVKGASLREWLEGRPPWRDVLSLFIQAGEGLRAAHEAGIIHRDFKPDNVFVTESGTAKVGDFGLARTGGGGSSPVAGGDVLPEADTLQQTSALLTKHGVLVGTPAYMSPEQFFGLEASSRSDIFSYSVALYEALYRERPFVGGSINELAAHVCAGVRRPLPSSTGVPRWVYEIVSKGLESNSEDRWGSMGEMVAVLRRQLTPRGRRWWGGVSAIALVGAVAGGLIARSSSRDELELCSGGEDAVRDVWNESRRLSLESSLGESDVSFAPEVAERLVARLDAFRGSWVNTHQSACMRHHRGESSSDVLDLQMACLEERRREVDTLVRVVVSADAAAIEKAISSLSAFDAPSDCLNPRTLQNRAIEPRDASRKRRYVEIRSDIAEAYVQGMVGQYDRSSELLKMIGTKVRDAGMTALKVESEFVMGQVLHLAGEYERSEEILSQVYIEARAIGHEYMAARSSVSLVGYSTAVQEHPTASRVRIWLAEAEIGRVGDELLAADLARGRGSWKMVQGEFEEALADYREALRLRRGMEGYESDPEIVDILRGIGTAHFKRGRNREARRYLEESYEMAGRVLGRTHPVVSNIMANLALVAAREGRYEDAMSLGRGALEISESARGRGHPLSAGILSNLGEIELQRGNGMEAASYLRRAVEIAEKSYGPNNGMTAMFLGSYAIAEYSMGNVELAGDLFRRALASAEASLGAEHPTSATFRANLGETLNDQELYTEAREALERALPALAKAIGEENPRLGPVERELARSYLGLGRVGEALRVARVANGRIAGHPEIPREEVIKTKLLLVRALAEGGKSSETSGAIKDVRAWISRNEPVRAKYIDTLDSIESSL